MHSGRPAEAVAPPRVGRARPTPRPHTYDYSYCTHAAGPRAGCAPPRRRLRAQSLLEAILALIESSVFLASPSSMSVFGLKKIGFSAPA